MKVKCMSNKFLDFARKNLIPLPSESKLQKEFEPFYTKPGLNIPSFEYLKALAPSLTETEKLFCLMFDEAKIKEHVEYEAKSDAILGRQCTYPNGLIAFNYTQCYIPYTLE